MTEPLFNYILTLPNEVQHLVDMSMKDKRAIAVLADAGIEVPQEVLDEIDATYGQLDRHDSVMDSMRPYL